ncbi:reverse transcriptase [Trichonephila clavipes]|nr:reverse transcriptase [Trichonephila clavipes]
MRTCHTPVNTLSKRPYGWERSSLYVPTGPFQKSTTKVMKAHLLEFQESLMGQVSLFKYLGINLDSKLHWGTHIADKTEKDQKHLNLLKRLTDTKWGAIQEVLSTVDKNYVHPVLDYSCEVVTTTLEKGSLGVGKNATNYEGEVLVVCKATTQLLAAGIAPEKVVFFIDSQATILALSMAPKIDWCTVHGWGKDVASVSHWTRAPKDYRRHSLQGCQSTQALTARQYKDTNGGENPEEKSRQLISFSQAGVACSHPRMPRVHQAGFSRRSLAGVGFFESVQNHGHGLALLTNGVEQQQQQQNSLRSPAMREPTKNDKKNPKKLGNSWETFVQCGSNPETPGAKTVARFHLTTGHDFLGEYFHWLHLVADEAYPLCGHAGMDGDHLLQCTGLY